MRPASVGVGALPARAGRPLGWALLFAAVAAIAVVAATRTSATPSPLVAGGAAVGVGIGVWMFFSERAERPLAVFLLYLGLLDGYLKLKTESSLTTLGRDALLYAIAIGILARSSLRRQALRLPPLSGWIFAFVAVVVVQLANPQNTGLQHTVGALRPHLEFVPLFFVGYAVLQTSNRLRTFLLLMLVIATANGVVGLVQLNLTPDQLASWGPGYRDRIKGTGTGVDKVSGRVYATANGKETRTRPFGLGSDSGSGAGWGMLALGGALALIALAARGSPGRLALLLCAGPPLAIITGQGRALVIASVIALLAYAAFATTARRLIPTLTSLLVGIAVVAGVIAYVADTSGSGVFDRYKTISPDKVSSTTSDDRGKSIDRIPGFFVDYPLGNGLGFVGPAAGFAGGGGEGSDGETEPTFLLSELGIPGLLVVLGFQLHLLWLGVTRIRRLDGEERMFVAALLSGLVGISVVWISAATTANAPFAPFLWLAGGALSYWLITVPKERSTRAARAEAAPA